MESKERVGDVVQWQGAGLASVLLWVQFTIPTHSHSCMLPNEKEIPSIRSSPVYQIKRCLEQGTDTPGLTNPPVASENLLATKCSTEIYFDGHI